MERTQALNAAYEILSDPAERQAYDEARIARERAPAQAKRSAKTNRNIAQDVHLKIEEFLRGTMLTVQVDDPSNQGGRERYELIIPPETAPGAKFRVPRDGGGFVMVRARALPGFRFKVRGSDLRCDMRINSKRAALGGYEMIQGATGSMVRVLIPKGVAPDEIIRIEEQGLPKARGGRGDLLVRIKYRPEVKITRSIGKK